MNSGRYEHRHRAAHSENSPTRMAAQIQDFSDARAYDENEKEAIRYGIDIHDAAKRMRTEGTDKWPLLSSMPVASCGSLAPNSPPLDTGLRDSSRLQSVGRNEPVHSVGPYRPRRNSNLDNATNIKPSRIAVAGDKAREPSNVEALKSERKRIKEETKRLEADAEAFCRGALH
jgi:hypothetical protein